VETPTPLDRAPASLADYVGHADLWLKREDLNELGMFKWRAALPVAKAYARRGHEAVVTSSTGNHGAAVAWACRRLGARAVVFVPPGATPSKLALLDRLGAEVRVEGRDFNEAKDAARAWAESQGLPFFEDGAEPLQYDAYEAIGDEILEQIAAELRAWRTAAVVIPVGDGALAGGVGASLGRRAHGVLRIGVVPASMPVMAESYEAGHPVHVDAGTTIADGLDGRVAIPLAVERLRAALDRIQRVSERAIAEALVACHDAGIEVEPSAAATVAAAKEVPLQGPIVLVMTGRNYDPAVLARARGELDSFPA
jgi:threonine dehydratase